MRQIKCLILFLVAVTILGGCVENFHYDGGPDKEAAVKMLSTEEFVVPVKAGYTTNVLNNGVLIASTSKPMTILIPKQTKQAVRSGSSSVTLSYERGVAIQSVSTLWQTLLFEDSRKGDFDYNDLIFNTCYKVTDNNLRVSVNPIALGSTKNIKLGFRWMQGARMGDVIVTDNCRQDLFDGRSGFVNTRNYDVHYGAFKKEIDVSIGGIAEPVYVFWFIIVDNNEVIFGVNTTGQKSFDKDGMPYGFAITDAGNGIAPKKQAPVRASYSDEVWENTIEPTDHSSWSFMPKAPVIPSNAVSMTEYEAWKAQKINHLKKGETLEKGLQYVSGFELYIEGTLNLTNAYGSGPATIYVMPGGVLNVHASLFENVNVVNFGTINFLNQPTRIQKSTIKSATSLTFPEGKSLAIGDAGKIYTPETITVQQLRVDNSGYVYAGNVNAVIVNLSNTSKLYVADKLNISSLGASNSSNCYVGCQLTATLGITISNNVVLSVKGLLKTPALDASAKAAVNINNGGIMDLTTLTIPNTSIVELRVIGSGNGVVKAETIDLSGGLNLENTFGGNMYLNFTQLKEGKKEIALDNPRLQWPGASVKVNSENATVPVTGCSPGFNPELGEDTSSSNVSSWFYFPKETVNINTCYNFSEWVNGNYDFNLKEGAQVFDVLRTDPKEGEQLGIYQMK